MKVLHERSKRQEMKISAEKVTKTTFKSENNICIKQPGNKCLLNNQHNNIGLHVL